MRFCHQECPPRAWNEETGHGANGVVFHAVIRKFGAIPDSEMAEICESAELPENLTYPAITPVLFDYLMRMPKLHRMKLKASPFRKIQNGSKTIELRLNDEKRQQVQVGDFIKFTMLDDTTQNLTVRVTALHHFNSFAELYAALPKKKSAMLLMKRQSPTIWMPIILMTSRRSTAFLVLNCG